MTTPVLTRQSLLWIFVSCVLLLVVRMLCWLYDVARADLAMVQVLVLPVVFLAISRIRICNVPIPRVALLLALGGITLGVVSSYTALFHGENVVLVARLAGDDLDASVRVLKEGITQSDKDVDLHVINYHSEIKDFSEARSVLGGNDHIHAIVYGKGTWLNVAMHADRAVSLSDFPEDSLAWLLSGTGELPPFEIITRPFVFGLSLQPLEETTKFLGELLPALSVSTATLIKETPHGYLEHLLSVQKMKSPWTSFAHKAIPSLALGNAYLIEFLRSKEPELGLLTCAMNAYDEAKTYLRTKDNPDLEAAITNNRAIARFLVGVMRNEQNITTHTANSFREATKLATQRNLFDAPSRSVVIAERNYARVVTNHTRKSNSVKRKKNGKKHHVNKG